MHLQSRRVPSAFLGTYNFHGLLSVQLLQLSRVADPGTRQVLKPAGKTLHRHAVLAKHSDTSVVQ